MLICSVTSTFFVPFCHNTHIIKHFELSEFIMSGEVKTIARALRSASMNTIPNGDLTFLELNGRRLIERVYDGEELKDQRMVAPGLREGSTAAYAIAKDRVSSWVTQLLAARI